MILAMSSRPCSTTSRYVLPYSHIHLVKDTGVSDGEAAGEEDKGLQVGQNSRVKCRSEQDLGWAVCANQCDCRFILEILVIFANI